MVNRCYRRFLTLFVIVFFVVVSSGCSSLANSASANGKIQLRWLVRSDPHSTPWAREMIKDFEKSHPNISVKLINVPQAQIDQKIHTMIAGGNLPDIVAANWANGGFMSYQDQLLNLNPYIKKNPHVLNGFKKKVVNLWKVNGQLKSIPISSLGSFLFYNKDLFDKAGLQYPPTNWDDKSWTWAKMVSDAKKLTNLSKNQYGVTDSLGPFGDARLFGGSFISAKSYNDGVLEKPTVYDPAVREGLTHHYDLIHKYHVSPSTAETSALTQLGDPFLTGHVAMNMVGGWGFWTYKPANFRWGVAALPYVKGHKPLLYVDIMGIAKNTPHPDAAWKFLKFITNPDFGLKKYMEETSATPPTKGLMNQWLKSMSKQINEPVAKIKQVQEGAIKHGVESANHMVKNWSTVNNYVNQPLKSYYQGNKTLKDTLAELSDLMNSLVPATVKNQK